MPKLDWIGKPAVVRHHLQVPYRLVHCNGGLSAGDTGSGNLLVQGDNLEALKALLPYYAGRVKCIYIDPPYNTGNDGWVYNDRVNSPQIRKWLDRAVGSEADDLCRHDKWLCMMYPRLRLLREFLRKDGVIFVSIDDNEQHRLRMMMDEIFGGNNFVASFVWHRKNVVQNDARFASVNHEYVMCYRKSYSLERFNLIQRGEEANSRYKNPDNDFRGPWQSVALQAKSGASHMVYSVNFPNGVIWSPPMGTFPKFSRKRILELYQDNRLWFGKSGKGVPRLKKYLSEVQQGLVSSTILKPNEVGSTQIATEVLKNIMEGDSVFSSPKPFKLIQRLISLVAGRNDIILDSFAGSGTTAHAVLQQNKEDGGNRKFILIEMDGKISASITAKRIQTVIRGYKNGDKYTAPLGGGFCYCTLGKPLFDQNGNIAAGVKFPDLAAHIFFCETGSPIPKRASGKTPLLGEFAGRAIYLLYNGVMGDKRPQGGNRLTAEILRCLPQPPRKNMTRIVYAESCHLGDSRLRSENITVRQTPYDIKTK